MKEIRLIKILKSLTREEIKSFGKYIQSPLFKGKRDTIPLYKLLVKFHPDFESEELDKEKILKKLPLKKNPDNKASGEGNIENLILALTKSAENFLIYLTFQKDEIERMLYLSQGYYERKLPDESSRVNRQIEDKLVPTLAADKDYLYKLKRLKQIQQQIYIGKNDLNGIYKGMENLFELSSLLYIFETVNFKKNVSVGSDNYGINLENKFLRGILDNTDFKKILDLFEDSCYNEHPQISLYFYQMKTIEEPDNLEFYKSFKKLLFENLKSFEKNDKYMLSVHVMNYCTAKWQNGVENFGKETVEVFKKVMGENSYASLDNPYLNIFVFRSMVLFGVLEKDIEWLDDLYNKHVEFVEPVHRDTLKHFAGAHLYFLKSQFKKSLECINKIDDDVFVFKFDIKNLNLKVYYELDYFDDIDYKIDAYKHFLKSNKDIGESFKKPARDFIKFYEELFKIKSGTSKDDASEIKSRIEREAPVGFKTWLLEKSNELI